MTPTNSYRMTLNAATGKPEVRDSARIAMRA